MTDIEIPYEKDRKGHYRFFEILPGALSWGVVISTLVLSFINIQLMIVLLLTYLIIFFIRSIGYDIRAIDGYITMRKQIKVDWNILNDDLRTGNVDFTNKSRPKWHALNMARRLSYRKIYGPDDVVHVAMIATVNESEHVLRPTIESVKNSKVGAKNIILVIAYEGRAGAEAQARVEGLIKEYKKDFKDALCYKHPANIPGEIIGKGGNITYAARQLEKYLKTKSIDPEYVLITTLDADNRPHPMYFSALTYMFCVVPNPIRCSFQPLPMFTNNIWDAPTLMRVIATANNLYYIVQSKRAHLQRNFSAHAQSMKSLIEMDFWSVRTVVEDGHQFWRSYFRYDGDYRVYPISIPIYQDAVMADTYLKTIKAQFIQLRRWSYGASDVAYIADKGFFHKNKIPLSDKLAKFLRTLEGHVTWAVGIYLVFGAVFLPQFFHPQNFAANQLPIAVSNIQKVGLLGALASVYICLVTLPKRPERIKRHHSVIMLFQWILAPVTGFMFGSLAAFTSQTRLMFKRYLSKFDVTEKSVRLSNNKLTESKVDPKS